MNKLDPKMLEVVIEELTSVGEASLEHIEQPKWGSVNFKSAEDSFTAVRAQAAELASMPLDSLSSDQVLDIFRELREVAAILEEMRTFTIEGGADPTDRRNKIVDRFELKALGFFSTYQQYIPYLAHRRGSLATDIEKIRGVHVEAKELLESTRKDIGSKGQELDQIISAARSAAPDAAIPTFADDFNDVADERAGQAWWWLIATAAMYILGISTLAYSLFTLADGTDTAKLLHHLAIKLPFVAVLLTGAFWCSRHHSVAKQQDVINRHRAHSIRTFRAFAEATDDPLVKDAVLAKAVECVFVHVPTGLTRQDSSQSQTQVLVDIGKALGRPVAGGQQPQG